MNMAIELHDSECLAVESNGRNQGSVLFDAYVHRTVGEPGVTPGEGGIHRIRPSSDAMSVKGVMGELPALIYEGSLAIATFVQDNLVPFPATYSESFRLSLMFADDARVLVVSGIGLSIESEREFQFVEPGDFSGHRGPRPNRFPIVGSITMLSHSPRAKPQMTML
jgi:hypothetical protein